MVSIGRAALLAGLVLWSGVAEAQSRYTPPDGCTTIATLRLPSCLVYHVANCGDGQIKDGFFEGSYFGRSYYSHPALFIRFEGADGRVSGHRYGTGVPTGPVSTGESYTYSRDVFRNEDRPPEPGDTGTETMEVGPELAIALSDRTFQVLDIRFEVTNPDTGYLYRERALLHRNPTFTMGVIAEVTSDDDSGSFSTIPESISLEGDPGFRSSVPSPKCLPSS